RAGLDPRRPGDPVHLEHLAELAQIDRDRAAISVADPRLDAADHAGPAAVRNRGDALIGTPRQHLLHLGLVARAGNQVGRVVDLTAKAANDVPVRLAETVRNPLVAIGGEEVLEG